MKNSKLFATLVFVAFAAFAALPLRAQTVAADDDHVIARTPLPVQSTPKSSSSGNWIKGQIIHVDNVEIVFSELNNPLMVHTFTYATALKPKMQEVVNNSAYHYGDHVRIKYAPQTTVALKIHLKHTKTTS